MNYAQQAFIFLQEKGRISHKDIQVTTNCNCSYSVLDDLKMFLKKQGKELSETWETNPVTKKRFKVYKVA